MSQRQFERLAMFCAGVFVGWIIRPTCPSQTPPGKHTIKCEEPEHRHTDARSSAYDSNIVTDIRDVIRRNRPAAVQIAQMEIAKYRLGDTA